MKRDLRKTALSVSAALLIVLAAGCSDKGTESIERVMSLSPTSLEFMSWAGSNPDPAQRKILVKMEGAPATDWSASATSDWVRIGPRGTDTIFVTVISTSLAAGVYDDTIIVVSDLATNTPLRLPVELTVLNRVTLSPSEMTFATLAGGQSPPAQELIIANFGVDSAGYVATTFADWLLLEVTSGDMPDTVTVSVDPTGLSAGHYQDSIVVTSPDLPQTRAVVPVHLSLSSWAALSLGPGQSGVNLEDVQFISPQIGWVSGWLPSSAEDPHGLVFRSADGGETWTRVLDRSPAKFGGLAAIDAARCFVVGDSSDVRYTVDDGQNWTRITDLPVTPTYNLRDLFFIGTRYGWIVGGQGLLLKSADSGMTWSVQPTPTSQDLTGIVFLDAQTGWVAGNHGTILHTGDGGITWTSQSSGTITDLRAIWFVDNLNGWAAGSNGLVLKTTNGGATWEALEDLGDVILLDIAFANAERGWVVGIDGSIFRTDDGGENWVRQSSDTTEGLAGVFFWDENLGWAVGTVGTVLKTASGGF